MKVSSNQLTKLAAAFAAVVVSTSSLNAQQLSWTATGDSTLGGSGTWNTAGINWWNGSTASAWSSNATATFAGGDGTYAVTLGNNATVGVGATSNATVGDLNFLNSGYTLSAASSSQILLGKNGGNAYLRVAAGKTAVIGNNVNVQRGSASGQVAIVGGGTLEVGAGGRLTQPLNNGSEVSGGSTLRINGGNATFATSLVIGDFGTGGGASGNLIIDGGSLTINSNNLNIGRTTGDVSVVTMNGGNLTTANNVNFGNGPNVVTGTFNLNGGMLTTGNVTDTATSNATFNFNGGTLRARGNSTTFMQGLDLASVLAGGAIIDSQAFNITVGQALSGVGGNFTKLGSGNLTLSGNSTYTGTTTISAGTLLVAASTGRIHGTSGIFVDAGGLVVNGSTGSGAVTVASGASLGGNGTIGGATVVNGSLNPGNSPGVLTVANNLTLNGTTTMEINGTATRGTDYDGVNVTSGGVMTFGGALVFTFGNLSALANDTNINLFSFAGTSLGNFSGVTSTGFYSGTWSVLEPNNTWRLISGGQTLTFSEVTGNLSVIPEPSTALLLGAGLAGLAVLRRRRKSA